MEVQDTRAVHVDHAQGVLAGDHTMQSNRFSTVTAGSGAIVVGGDIVMVSREARALVNLSPGAGAARLEKLEHDQKTDVLAAVPPDVSAGVLEILVLAGREALAVSLLADIRFDIASMIVEILVARLGPDKAWLEQVPMAAVAVRRSAAVVRPTLGDTDGRLLPAVPSQLGTTGFYQSFARGLIHWTDRVGAQVTRDEISECHISFGGSGGGLGFPVAPESAAGRDGRMQRFEGNTGAGGAVYWSGQPGESAHATWGSIGERYQLEGGPRGELGYPLNCEVSGVRHGKTGTEGAYQCFERGAIYCATGAKAIVAPALIVGYHDRYGGIGGRMGFPVSDYRHAEPWPPNGTAGRYQRFQWDQPYPLDSPDGDEEFGGTVYVSDLHGVHAVSNEIGIFYEAHGGTGGPLGFPRSDEIDGRTSYDQLRRCYQYFEGGIVFWKEEYGAVTVSGPILQLLEREPSLRIKLGFPISAQTAFSQENGQPQLGESGQMQFFEHGVVAIRNGIPVAYLGAELPIAIDLRPITLSGFEFNPAIVSRGQPIALEYRVSVAPGYPIPVVLGASLIAGDGKEYYDKTNDLRVDLTHERTIYRRLFWVPASAAAGMYRLIGAVWHPTIGEQRLDTADLGFALQVSLSVAGERHVKSLRDSEHSESTSLGGNDWAPVVYGRTKSVDSWWRAVPENIAYRDGWLSQVVRTAMGDGRGLDKPRFILTRGPDSRILVGVVSWASDLSDDMNLDMSGRRLYCFVGWTRTGSAAQMPSLDELRQHWQEWAGPVYREWIALDWNEPPSKVREPHVSRPSSAPWASRSNTVDGPWPRLGSHEGNLDLWPLEITPGSVLTIPNSQADTCWARGLVTSRSYVFVAEWFGDGTLEG